MEIKLPNTNEVPNIPHRCSIADFCIAGDTTILFCIFCKQVIGFYNDEETKIKISIYLDEELLREKRNMKEYDKEKVQEWI